MFRGSCLDRLVECPQKAAFGGSRWQAKSEIKITHSSHILEKAVMKKTKASAFVVLVLLCMAWGGVPAFAFGIRPEATELDGKVRRLEPSRWTRVFDRAAMVYIERFVHPVHEQVTHCIYGCTGDRDACSSPDKAHSFAPDAVIAGIRWNDNPPFEMGPGRKGSAQYAGKTIRLPNYSAYWFKLFRHAEKEAREGKFFDAESDAGLLYRVHFGDMQFLHAMAARDGEKASETKRNMMMWAEFTYRLALGEIDRGIEIRKTGIPGMEKLFYNRGWTSQQLFTRGDPTFRGDRDFRDVAFGSLLHMVEDSFTGSHVRRDEPGGAKCEKTRNQFVPGKILRFYAYATQDHERHQEEDTHEAFERHHLTVQPSVVEVGKVIKGFYDAGRPWPELREYLECVFELDDPDAEAGP